MRNLMWVVFLLAFILGAFASLKVDVPKTVTKDEYLRLEVKHTPAWEFYILAMFLGFGSLLMMRNDQRMSEDQARQSKQDEEDLLSENLEDSPINLLVRINENLAQIEGNESHLATIEATQKLCTELSYHRHNYLRNYGLNRYAAFFEPFSHGERYLNRSWSTNVDNCMVESTKSLLRARTYFIQALEAARS